MSKQLLLPFRHLLLLILFAVSFLHSQAQQVDGRLLIQDHLRQQANSLKLVDKTIESIIVTTDYVDNKTGVRHIYANQQLNGLAIPDGAYSLHIRGNKIVDANNIIDLRSVQVRPASASISASAAVLTRSLCDLSVRPGFCRGRRP